VYDFFQGLDFEFKLHSHLCWFERLWKGIFITLEHSCLYYILQKRRKRVTLVSHYYTTGHSSQALSTGRNFARYKVEKLVPGKVYSNPAGTLLLTSIMSQYKMALRTPPVLQLVCPVDAISTGWKHQPVLTYFQAV
jgi:hypothetical protein